MRTLLDCISSWPLETWIRLRLWGTSLTPWLSPPASRWKAPPPQAAQAELHSLTTGWTSPLLVPLALATQFLFFCPNFPSLWRYSLHGIALHPGTQSRHVEGGHPSVPLLGSTWYVGPTCCRKCVRVRISGNSHIWKFCHRKGGRRGRIRLDRQKT